MQILTETWNNFFLYKNIFTDDFVNTITIMTSNDSAMSINMFYYHEPYLSIHVFENPVSPEDEKMHNR